MNLDTNLGASKYPIPPEIIPENFLKGPSMHTVRPSNSGKLLPKINDGPVNIHVIEIHRKQIRLLRLPDCHGYKHRPALNAIKVE